ncbi:MAG: acyl-CoA thioesterase [Pseudomonadota bacterium]
MANNDARPISASRTLITELMIPAYANFGGKIHGGILLSLMDKAAYACATRHAGSYCVTVSVDGVDFLQPVEVGDLVSLKASVNYVGRTSLVVGIRVEAENVERAVVRHTNTSYFTMVAKAPDGALLSVPPLILENEEDIRRFVTAAERRVQRARDRAVVADYREGFRIDDRAREVLARERCVVAGREY